MNKAVRIHPSAFLLHPFRGGLQLSEVDVQLGAGGEDDGAFDDVFELADVAGPGYWTSASMASAGDD